MATGNRSHLLRLVLNCRRITAQVTNLETNSIVAMASSSEQAFAAQYKFGPKRFPKPGYFWFWDAKDASIVGEKLALRLREIGVSAVRIDDAEELSRPVHVRRCVSPLFYSVKLSGIDVAGSQDLEYFSVSSDR